MSGVTITGIFARQIYDSRGNPTVEVDVTTQQGQFRACVPSGASTGEHEAIELRDKDEKHHGKGVTQAVNNVNTKIGPEIIGMDPRDQQAIDMKMIEMDGTPNKGNFGANAILGVSLAVARAGASANGVPLYQHIANLAGNPGPLVLPVPAFNIINGGSHAGNKLYMQEFMMLPTGAQNFREAMQMGSETYHHLKKLIKAEYGQDAVNVGDEGGFAPNIQSPGDCWRLISQAVANAGYTGRVKFGMDVAASEFFTKETNTYNLNKWNENPEEKDAELNAVPATALADIYKDWIGDPEVPIATIEDGFAEDDWGAWREFEAFNKENGDANIQTVGDDLLVTNVNRMEMARAEDGDATKPACNALLLKVNQIGSLTEAINAVKFAKENGWGVMTSHRSGETEDTFIADLAVGLSTGQIKTGAPCRSERMAKYNQLMRIEEELDANAVFAGENFRRPSDWLFPPQ